MSDDAIREPRLANRDSLTRGMPEQVPLYHPSAEYTVTVNVPITVTITFPRPFDGDEWRRELTYKAMDDIAHARWAGGVDENAVTWSVDEVEPDDKFDAIAYTMCAHCAHFVALDTDGDGNDYWCHLHNGSELNEDKLDHDGAPGETKTLAEWRVDRPELFTYWPDDDAIGPNSKHFKDRKGWSA